MYFCSLNMKCKLRLKQGKNFTYFSCETALHPLHYLFIFAEFRMNFMFWLQCIYLVSQRTVQVLQTQIETTYDRLLSCTNTGSSQEERGRQVLTQMGRFRQKCLTHTNISLTHMIILHRY